MLSLIAICFIFNFGNVLINIGKKFRLLIIKQMRKFGYKGCAPQKLEMPNYTKKENNISSVENQSDSDEEKGLNTDLVDVLKPD